MKKNLFPFSLLFSIITFFSLKAQNNLDSINKQIIGYWVNAKYDSSSQQIKSNKDSSFYEIYYIKPDGKALRIRYQYQDNPIVFFRTSFTIEKCRWKVLKCCKGKKLFLSIYHFKIKYRRRLCITPLEKDYYEKNEFELKNNILAFIQPYDKPVNGNTFCKMFFLKSENYKEDYKNEKVKMKKHVSKTKCKE